MNYEKLTPEKFTEKLKDGSYESLTGARRAIGKASWPETQKAIARTAAEKFFGGAASAKPAKAAPAKKQSAAKAKTKTGGTVVKAAAEPKAKKIAKAPRTHAAASEPQGFAIPGKQLTLADVRKNPFQVIQLSEHCVASGTGVLNALTAMKAQNPNLDVTEPTAAAVNTIRQGLDLASKVIQSLSEGMDVPKAIADAISANGVTQASPVVPGEPVYTSPTAEA